MHPYSRYFFLVLGLYILATFIYCIRVILGRRGFSIRTFRLVLISFIVHAVILGLHFYQTGYPFFTSSFEWYQIISLSVVLAFLVLCFSQRFVESGVIILPLALVIYVISLTNILARQTPGHVLQNPWMFVHIVFMLIAVSIFMISFVTGILYVIAERRIKKKRMGGFFDRLPSLENLESIHYRGLNIGFVFFTIGIITGGGLSKSLLGVYVTNNFKQILSFALWVFFALLLNLRVSRGWVGRKGILLAGAGFVGVLLLMIGAGR